MTRLRQSLRFISSRDYSLFTIVWITSLVATIICVAPGLYSPDSIALRQEAGVDLYNSYQPVLLAWWINKLNFLGEGAFLLALQNILMYWVGYYILFKNLARHFRFGGIVILLALLSPAAISQVGIIWKDIAFGTSQFLAYALIYNISNSDREKRHFLGRAFIVLLLVFGIGVKTNGITVLPITVLYWLLSENIRTNSRKFIVLFIALVSGSIFMSSIIVPKSKIISMPTYQYIMTYDILNISIDASHNYLPAYQQISKKVFSPEDLQIWRGVEFDDFFWGNEPSWNGVRTGNQANLNSLKLAWATAITSKPDLYVANRVELWNSFLLSNISPDTRTMYIARPHPDDRLFSKKMYTLFNQWHYRIYEFAAFVYSPLIFLLASIAVLLYGLTRSHRTPDHIFITFTNIAVWAFALPHLFILPTTEFRYFYFPYIMISASFAIFILDWLRVRHKKLPAG